jgi:hypothetical protein
MPWGYFRNMTDDDLKAIYAYLQTVTPGRYQQRVWQVRQC